MSIRKVAHALGVSTGTVSLALNGDPRVNADTRDRILKYCRDIQYTPSFTARNLSKGRSSSLHVVYTTDPGQNLSHFLTDFLEGATDTAHAQNYRITLSLVRDNTLARLDPYLRDGSADGFLLLNPNDNDDYQQFALANTRVVVIGRSAALAPHVDTDNYRVGYDVGVHLHEHHYRAPALIGLPQRTLTQDRLAGLRQLFPEAPCIASDGHPDETHNAVHQALNSGCDAIVVTDDAMLPVILKAIRSHGRLCPQVGLVGMGNDLSAHLDPEITSVDMNAHRLGAIATRTLLDLIHGRDTPPLTTVPHCLISRTSTRRSLTTGGPV